MRIFFKVLKIALLVFFILVVALIVTARLMEDRITKLAIEKVSESINAPFDMESVSFSLIRDFPLATVQFDGIWLGAPRDSSQSQSIDTLARFDRVYFSVESRPLLENIFNVLEVEMEGGYVKYTVDTLGATCFDFLLNKDNEQDTVQPVKMPTITLDNLELNNITCDYRDEKLKAKAKIFIPEIEGTAKIDSVTMIIAAKGGLKITECSFGQSNLYKMKQADLQFDLLYDEDSVKINSLEINTEGALLESKGKLAFGSELYLDFDISGSELDLAELVKYIPSEQLKEYEVNRIAGMLNLQGRIKGQVSDSLMPFYDGKFNLSKGKIGWGDYPEIRNISLSGSASNGKSRNNASTAIRIDKLKLQTGNSYLDLKGSVSNLDKIRYDVKTRVNLDLKSARPFVPDTVVKNMDGHLQASIETSGILPDSIDVEYVDYLLNRSKADILFSDVNIDLDSINSFHQISGFLQYANHNVLVDSLNIHIPLYDLTFSNSAIDARVDGDISNLDSLLLDMKSFYLAMDRSTFSGQATIKNLNHPKYKLRSEVDIDLAEVKKFIPDSLVKNVRGKVKASIMSDGAIHLDSIGDQISDLIYDRSKFDVSLEDVWLDMPDTLLNVSEVSGRINVGPDLIKIKGLKGVYSGISFQFDTTVVKNLYNTVLRDKPGKLDVQGVFRFSHLDYGRLDSFFGSDSVDVEETIDETEESVAEEQKESWDRDYEIKGKLYVSSLKYENALIEDVSSLFNVKDSSYIFDQLQLNAFGGSMNSSLRVDFEKSGKTALHLRNKIDGMDIRRLFYELNDFDQKEFSYKNISGILTTQELFTRVKFIGDSVIYPDIRMVGDFTLEKGGIYNFEPVEVIAPSIPGIDRLDTLEFKTIQNHIFVLRDTLCVPETYLVSNKFDISTIGMQSLGLDFEYHLEVRLKEILLGTSKRRRREKDKIEGPVEKGDKNAKWVRLYTDENGNPKMKILGNKNERILMSYDIMARESLLNLRFNPKIVSFKTDVEDMLKAWKLE